MNCKVLGVSLLMNCQKYLGHSSCSPGPHKDHKATFAGTSVLAQVPEMRALNLKVSTLQL